MATEERSAASPASLRASPLPHTAAPCEDPGRWRQKPASRGEASRLPSERSPGETRRGTGKKMEEHVKDALKHVESKPLHKFTIPKIKRSLDKECLVRCMTSRREYSELQNTLKEARLNIRCELENSWTFGDVMLAMNPNLENSFFLKRSEMRELGRHGRELEISFCFLVLSNHSATNICGHGLGVNNISSNLLGNPLMGVYLFRHIDVALNFSQQNNTKSNTVLVFKVLFGKVKKVNTTVPSKMKAALDPTPNFDCHMSKKAPAWSDPFEEQIANSLVYLYEYDTNIKAVETPRHCLPYALITVTYLGQKAGPAPSLSTVKVHHKMLPPDKDKLMNCTVAKRIGKGKDATIIYENIRSPVVKTPSWAKEDSPYCDIHILQQELVSYANNEQCFGNTVPPNTFHSFTTDSEKNGPQKCDTHIIPSDKGIAETEGLISSSMVITSKSIKDPRLIKRSDLEYSKPEDHHIVDQLKFDYTFSQTGVESCNVTKPFYLSFEETRIYDEQLKKNGKTCFSFVEPEDKDRHVNTEFNLKQYHKEISQISQKTTVCAKLHKNDVKQEALDHKVEQPTIQSYEGNKLSDSQEISQVPVTTCEAPFGKQIGKNVPECNFEQKLHFLSLNKHEVNTQGSKDTFPKNIQKQTKTLYCLDENTRNQSTLCQNHEIKSFSVGNLKSTRNVKYNIKTVTLTNRTEQSTDSNQIKANKDKKSNIGHLIKVNKRTERNLFNVQAKSGTENIPSPSSGLVTNKKNVEVPVTFITCKPDGIASLCNKEQFKSSADLKFAEKKKIDYIPKSSPDSQKMNSNNTIQEYKKTSKETFSNTKHIDCNTSKISVRGSETKTLLHKKNSPRELLHSSKRMPNFSSTKKTIIPKKQIQNPMNTCETKLQDITTENEQTICVNDKCKSETHFNMHTTVESKDDHHIREVTSSVEVSSSKLKLLLEEASRVVQNIEENPKEIKEFFHENQVSKNKEGNILSEQDNLNVYINDLLWKSKESMALSSCFNTGDSSVKDNIAKFHNSESLLVKKVSMKQNMPSKELNCIQRLESRIDWKELFGIESAVVGEITNSVDAVVNESTSLDKTPDSPSGLQPFQRKLSDIFGNYNKRNSDDQITGRVPQITNKLAILCSKAGVNFHDPKLNPNRRSDEENKTPNSDNSSTVEISSQSVDKNIKSIGKEFPNTKINSKVAHVTVERKQTHSVLKKKRLINKNIHRSVVKRSVGRIKKFSQSEENIKSVLSMLSDEATSCKSKRISKKLDRAILHLRKAHKRVQKSLQLVERRNLLKPQNLVEPETNTIKQYDADKSIEVPDNINTVKSNEDVQKMSSLISLIPDLSNDGSENKPKNQAASDIKCLATPMRVINRMSELDQQQTKTTTLSTTPPIPRIMKCVSFNYRKSSPDGPVNHILECAQANKENSVPMLSIPEVPVEDTHIKMCVQHCKSSTNLSHNLSQTKPLPVSTMKTMDLNDVAYINEKKVADEKASTKQHIPLKTKSNSLIRDMSRLLQKADETYSLKSLQKYKLICKKMLPTFIKAFEKKQKCSFKDVTVSRKLLINRNIKVSFKHLLKPCAIEPFIELQMMMETSQFIDNRIHYLLREPTFRSLLWYDPSLYTELIAGEFGYQQQSHLYKAFQEKLKHNALTTLQNHHTQLSEVLEGVNENKSSYYVLLKYRREIEECKAILKNSSDHSEFSLSIPLTCGVNIGDTIDDLETLQKSTLELIRTFANLSKCDPGKQEHALCLLEVISAKIDFIKTSESITLQLSLFSIEHLLFDAAKSLVVRQRSVYSELKKTTSLTKELTINHFALSKLYEIYGTPCEEISSIPKKDDLSRESVKDVGYHPQHEGHYVGKIIDQARCTEPYQLQQMILECEQHFESLKKYFQILQECDADQVLITESNVLQATKTQDQLTILLKPEAVETYIEICMTYETLRFLHSLTMVHTNQKRNRSLLYYDSSLVSDLIQSQHKIVSYLKGSNTSNALVVIESTISEIKSELEIICDWSDSVNYTYALQIMTRELSELSELKSFVMESQSELRTYIHFSPFAVSIHYGSTAADLEYNYNQLSDTLGLLMSAPKKDLGKMAHTMKIMKTIEIMKDAILKSNKATFDLITCQIERQNCDQDILGGKEKAISKMAPEQFLRKRTKTSDQGLSLSPKKKKVQESPPSRSAGEEAILPSSLSVIAKDGDSRKNVTIQNNSHDDSGNENMDLDSSSLKSQEIETPFLQYGQQSNNQNNQSLVPVCSSNNQLASYAYPLQYSLCLSNQNSSDISVMTQSYHRNSSYETQQNLPYYGSPVFSMQNSYANQPYSSFANQMQSPMLLTHNPFTAGMNYNYRAYSSQYAYDPSTRVWSWDSWQ
ncbi:testis-expressed protein 15 [Pelodytes ibericus]